MEPRDKQPLWLILLPVILLVFAFGSTTAYALLSQPKTWEARFNQHIAGDVTVDTTNGSAPQHLRFSFDLAAARPSYTGIVCWGWKGDPRLSPLRWNEFRQAMNSKNAQRIGLAITPISKNLLAATLTVPLDTNAPKLAQARAQETIHLLKRYSPCQVL